ncbi:MAG: N-methyl-L-tryptophan oxidase [Candidatus Dormibacteraceae bacterium]
MRVAVVGCGAMGAATGWRLAKRGAKVVCFDRHSPPHSFGSSHGESRITRTAYFEGPWYVPLLQETFPLWRELEHDADAQLLTMTGALMIGQRSTEVVRGALAAASEHRLDARLLDADELRRGYPAHVVSEGDVAVLDAQAGFIRPEPAVAAMIDGLTSLGGEVRRRVVVTEISSRSDGVEVATAGTVDKFDAVVIAAGAWARELVSLPLTVERQVLAWLEIEKDPDSLTPARFPVFFRETNELGDIYGFPTLDGDSVKIARHHDGKAADPDSVSRDVTEAELEPLRTFARTHLRGVGERVTRTAVCMYTNTPDRHFAIGLQPDDPRIVVISACSGHGFKFAPVIGEIGADLVCQGQTSRDIEHFSLARFAQPK